METTLDIRDFRSALGQFATGVTVITAKDANGAYVGVTASSFNTVSMSPPLVLWSLDKNANTLETFKNSGHFTVNVLSEEQMHLSNQFARKGTDKFYEVPFSHGIGGCPIIADCSAHFECELWNVYDGGDHFILIGKVMNYQHAPDRLPLIFSKGQYGALKQHPLLNA